MLIKIKKASDVRSSEITPKSLYMHRRHFLGTAAARAALAPLLASTPAAAGESWHRRDVGRGEGTVECSARISRAKESGLASIRLITAARRGSREPSACSRASMSSTLDSAVIGRPRGLLLQQAREGLVLLRRAQHRRVAALLRRRWRNHATRSRAM